MAAHYCLFLKKYMRVFFQAVTHRRFGKGDLETAEKTWRQFSLPTDRFELLKPHSNFIVNSLQILVFLKEKLLKLLEIY